MNIYAYKAIVEKHGIREYPFAVTGTDPKLEEYIDFEDCDIDLKIYLSQLILKRSFYGTYMAWPDDVRWFARSFFADYTKDHIRPYLTEAIREACMMIMSDELHTKSIIGTTFMFGIIEFYAKHHLGFQPLQYNFSDDRKHDYTTRLFADGKRRKLTLSPAFRFLQKESFPISDALNEIDRFTKERLSQVGIMESKDKRIHYKIYDRLSYTRNPLLHGEQHSFFKDGPYIVMLYILFHLMKEKYRAE